MKYVALIHSNPQPWGHPTGDFVKENQDLPQDVRDKLTADFEALLTEMQERGELLGGEALGDPKSSRLFHWSQGNGSVTNGPYSEAGEHLAGFFLIDVDSPERAEQIGRVFAGATRCRRMP